MASWLKRWLSKHRSFCLSLSVGSLLLMLLPSLISTPWGGYCLQQLIGATTRFEVNWKTCSMSWFEDTRLEGLTIIDHRAQATAYVEHVDSTWRPSFLLSSPRSIGITSLQGADITFSLPRAHIDEWPYPFIPSSLPASHRSKLPIYGTLRIDVTHFLCKVKQGKQIELKDATLFLEVPRKKGKIVCALSATALPQEEGAKIASLNLNLEYTPESPRKLLQTHADALRALMENRLHLDMQVHHFPTLLLDAFLQIRNQKYAALISTAIGTSYDCDIKTQTEGSPHLAITWNHPLLQGACKVALSHTTKAPLQVHWDAQLMLKWNQKESLISSSGDYTLPLLALQRGTLHHVELAVETLPTPLLDHLLKQERILEPLLGETVALHLSMDASNPHKEGTHKEGVNKKETHTLRILCLAPNLTCDPIQLEVHDKNLTLLHPIHVWMKHPSMPLHLTCEAFTTSSSKPCEAHFTLPIGKVALSLSTLTLPLLHSTPFQVVGQAHFSPHANLLEASLPLPYPSLFGASLDCSFSACCDPVTQAPKGEFFIKGEKLEGELACNWLSRKEMEITRSKLVWKPETKLLAALQERWPFLKDWTLYDDVAWIFTVQNGPLPLSLKGLKKMGRAFTVHAHPLPLLHLPSQTTLPLQLDAFVDANMHASLHVALPPDVDGDQPTLTLEGSLRDLFPPSNAHEGPQGQKIACCFTGTKLPTSLLAMPLNGLADGQVLSTWLMGSHFTLEGSLAMMQEARQMQLHVTSASGVELHLDATKLAKRYSLNRPCTLTLPLSLLTRPIDSSLLAKENLKGLLRALHMGRMLQNPSGVVSLTLSPENSFLQLPFSSWEDVEIGQLAIKLGEVTLQPPKKRSALFSLLPKAVGTKTRPLSILTTPLFLSLHHGNLLLKRVDALIAGRYPIAFWGRIKIPKDHVKATLAISATALRIGYGLSDVSAGYFLLLPMSGSIGHVALHKTKALTRLTALSLHSDGGIPGAFLGSFAHWLSGGFDPSQVPSQSSPIPWASLEEDLRKEQHNQVAKQEPNLSSTLIAPFQAVHRGIQNGVRKGADLLFNFLR